MSLVGKLDTLTEGNSEEKRTKWALAHKHDGQKIVGVISSYVPEEIIFAAGLFPWHITGSWDSDISLAGAYRSPSSCLYCTHVLQSLLTGKYDFLDAVVVADWDQDYIRLWDVWTHLRKTAYTHIIHVPHQQSDLACSYFAEELRLFGKALETFGGKKITDTAIFGAIDIYNQMRLNLLKLYELRKRAQPVLSGAEVLGITTTAGVMPKEEFNKEIEACLPSLEERQVPLSHLHPRIMISSDTLDNPVYIEAAEEAGCLVAMDDLETGSRYFWELVDTSLRDPYIALAKRYLYKPGSPRMLSWDKQLDQLIQWARDFNIEGIIELNQLYSGFRAFRTPYLKRGLSEAGIPNISIERQYQPANLGQFKTRVGGFLEMVGSRG